MNDLVQEFFYEGIRRIVPGLILIVLYWRIEVENIFKAHTYFFSPLLFGACLLVFAWLIGFVVEVATFAPLVWILRKLHEKFPNCERLSWICKFLLGQSVGKKPSPLVTDLEIENDGLEKKIKQLEIEMQQLKEKIEDKGMAREERRQYYLSTTSKMMSRCLIVIFLFALWRPPEQFSNFHWHRYWFAGIGAGGFFNCVGLAKTM